LAAFIGHSIVGDRAGENDAEVVLRSFAGAITVQRARLQG